MPHPEGVSRPLSANHKTTHDMANVFINDPLLGGQANYQQQIDELSRMQRELEERKNAFMSQRAVSNKPVQPSILIILQIL